jgi:hypothetical protein
MKNKSKVMKAGWGLLLALAAAGIVAGLLAPVHTKAPKQVAGGRSAALREIYLASNNYRLGASNNVPSSLDDLNGVFVTWSGTKRVLFSRKRIDDTLGESARSLRYFPEFFALTGEQPAKSILLAAVPKPGTPNAMEVLLLDGSIVEVSLSSFQSAVDSLRSQLESAPKRGWGK